MKRPNSAPPALTRYLATLVLKARLLAVMPPGPLAAPGCAPRLPWLNLVRKEGLNAARRSVVPWVCEYE